jgi:rhamnosyl/mannosyltransferase
MKVVHAAKFYPPVPGGIERVVKDLCDLTAGDWEVQVVAANTQASTVTELCGRVAVTRAAAWGRAHSVPLCPSLPLRLWRARADIVVLHEPNPLSGTALALHTPAPRLLIWHHSDLLRPAWAPWTYGRLQRSLYRRASCVIVSSPALAATSSLVRQARRVAVVPFGVDVRRFQQPDERQRAAADTIRRRFPGPLVLFVGRFVYYKGLDVLVDAMAGVPGTLLLAGNGPLEADIRQRAADRGLSDRVHFLGRVENDDLVACYHAADVFVLPSVAPTETFGIVQIEAMAAGLPVVSTNLPTGVPWVNEDGRSGLVVPPGDGGALAGAVARLCADRELRARLSAHARRRAEQMFSVDRMIQGFRAVVEEALREPEWPRDREAVGAGAR